MLDKLLVFAPFTAKKRLTSNIFEIYRLILLASQYYFMVSEEKGCYHERPIRPFGLSPDFSVKHLSSQLLRGSRWRVCGA